MCSSLVPAYSEALGVCRVTSQVCFLARASRSACRSGSYLAMAWATTVSTAFAPQRCSRGAICSSTHAGGLLGQGVGERGDLAGLPGRHLQRRRPVPGLGEPVAQLEGVGDQLLRGQR